MSSDSKELKNDLDILKRSSRDLINTLYNHKFGVPRIQSSTTNGGDTGILTTGERELLKLYDEIEELNLAIMTLNEILKVQNKSDSSSPSTEPSSTEDQPKKPQQPGAVVRYTTDMSQINVAEEQQLVEALQDKINILSHRNKLKDLAVENLLSTIPIKDAVYGAPRQRESALLSLLAVRDDLEADVLQSTSHLRKLKLHYDELKTSSLKSHANNKRALDSMVYQIEEQFEAFQASIQNDKDIKERLRVQLQELHASKNKTAILGDLIPMLITGSGIDWGNDQELIDILLSCGSIGLDLNEKEELYDIIFS